MEGLKWQLAAEAFDSNPGATESERDRHSEDSVGIGFGAYLLEGLGFGAYLLEGLGFRVEPSLSR